LKKNSLIKINIHGEDGIDAGGLFREWISNVINMIVDPIHNIFITSSNGYFNLREGEMNEEELKLCQLAGLLFARAIVSEIQIFPRLTRSLIKILLGIPISLKDLYSINSKMASSLEWLIQNSVEKISLTF
jgi:hypothetical protein